MNNFSKKNPVILALLLILKLPLLAQETNLDLLNIPVEDLMHVRVTSVSKYPESRFDAAAAIYVISNEELLHNGFTTIADSLRTVPGLDVGQVSAHTWAVTSRGFNGEYASKLLVLSDGRSLYTPLSAGVYWDVQDMMMEDIDRIEVIRGPGASLWGANAVDGVINIITKDARETQGLLATGGGGSMETGFGSVRYGDRLGSNAWFRVYAKYTDRDDTQLANGSGAGDRWWMVHEGFRVDWEPSPVNVLTWQGDVYQADESQLLTLPLPSAPYSQTGIAKDSLSGGNLLGRWTHTLSEDSSLKLQGYYDHTDRESNLPDEKRDTFDLQFQHDLPVILRNQVIYGLGYNVSSDQIRNGFSSSFTPNRLTLNLVSAFVQDEIPLMEERLKLTFGSKFEHNDFTGFEVQPSVRLAWTPTRKQTLWASVGRAVRTPAEAEEDVRVNLATQPPSPSVVSIVGNPLGVSEELLAYEMGYRFLPRPNLSLDAAVFYNDYQHLRSLEPGAAAPTPPNALETFYSANKLKGDSYGAEFSAEWQVSDTWRLRSAYSYLSVTLTPTAGSLDRMTTAFFEGSAPSHQFSLHSLVNITRNLDFDCGLRFVDRLHDPEIPAYTTMDARLAWHPSKHWEFAVVGLNLLTSRHLEFDPQVINTPSREVPRSVYGKVTCRF